MIKKLFNQKSFQIYFFICLGAIEFLATTTIHIEIVESMWDKSNHFVAFFVLYVLLSLAYKNLSAVVKLIVLLAFGTQIELVQELIGRSHFSPLDIVADSIGIMIGFFVILFFKNRVDSSI